MLLVCDRLEPSREWLLSREIQGLLLYLGSLDDMKTQIGDAKLPRDCLSNGHPQALQVLISYIQTLQLGGKRGKPRCLSHCGLDQDNTVTWPVHHMEVLRAFLGPQKLKQLEKMAQDPGYGEELAQGAPAAGPPGAGVLTVGGVATWRTRFQFFTQRQHSGGDS